MYRKIAAFTILFAAPAFTQSEADYKALKQQLDVLKSDMESLKRQQGAIIQQLVEMQRMLAQQKAASNPTIDLTGAPETGSKDAKIAMVEFTDFWCGFCARFAKTTLPELMKEYVSTGKVRYYVKDFAAQRGPKVSEAAHCAAEQGKYWQLHDKLFENYGKYSDTELSEYVQQTGADPTIFQKCVESARYSKLVSDSMEQGSTAGVEGTPTFMLGTIDPADPTKLKSVRTIVGAQSVEQFRAAINAVIESSK
jgi:protein-disulfide isomerase